MERNGPIILIVDDDFRNLKLLQSIFKLEGIETLAAPDGPEARAIASREQPDIILLDIMMPGESGFDTCAKLKADPITADIPIIFLSAVDDVQSKVNGLSMGAVDYITKPFARAEVLARTRLHLNLRAAYKTIIEEQAAKLKQIQDAQLSILVNPEDLPEAKFQVAFNPAQEAGGDFYDVFHLGKDVYGFFIADISGHDLKASYVTAALKALIKQNTGPTFTLIESAKIMNGVLKQTLLTEGGHLTFCYASLNRIQLKMTVIGGGHPPLVYLPNDGPAASLRCHGDVLGAFSTVSFEPVEIRVDLKDRFFLYTDGLIEVFDSERKRGRSEGIKELTGIIERTRELPMDEAIRIITAHMIGKTGKQQDDVILLGVEV